MPTPMPRECFNCGPTENALVAKNLCTSCYRKEKVRNRFDPKANVLVWNKTKIAELRYSRNVLRMSYSELAAVFNTNARQIRLALRKYKIRIDFTCPKVRRGSNEQGRTGDT